MTTPDAPPATLNVASLAAQIAQTPDPGAFLAQLVPAVAAHSDNAAGQGRMLSAVKGICDSTLKRVREALLSYVSNSPGTYDGFVIYERAGSRTIDYDKLQAEYPDAYDELVRIGNPSLTVRYAN